MIVVYRIDYSLIGKYSKWIATIFLLFFAFQIFIVEMRLNGTLYMRILSKVLIMSPLFFLYVPLFGAILYQYRGKGWRVVPKIFIWMALPLFLIAGAAESRGNHFTIFHAGKPIDHCCMERMVYIP